MVRSIFIIALVWCMYPQVFLAQKALRKQGDIYFESGKYREALAAYKAYKKTEKTPKLLIKRGLCYLYTNHPDACIADMAAAHKLKSLDHTRFKYSGMAYFAKKEYTEAAKFYKTYLNTLKPGTEEWHKIVKEIKRCGYSKNYMFWQNLAFIENLGSKVNTIHDEFGPVQSPTKPGRYYFSSARAGTIGGLRDKKGLSDVLKGTYSSDMFMVDLKDGNWGSVMPFEQLINTPKHDILQDFSQDGAIIYYIKSSDLNIGTLYTDTFNIDRDPTKLPDRADLPLKAERGDKDLFVFSDSLIIFSSKMDGGYGGYDLYYASKKANNWQEPINLGAGTNTDSDEIAPFLIKNGETLFFSSDRTETLGGFDIFVSTYNSNKGWENIKNLGIPINSPGNDVDFELSFDGISALFASDRVDAYGGKDLYIAYFKDQILGHLAYVEVPDFMDMQHNLLLDDTTKLEVVQQNQIIKDPGKSRDFVSKPLYFSKNEDVLNKTNLNQIAKIAELMVIFPDIKVLLTSHFISEGRTEFDLYFSMKRAEKVADELIKSGINGQRILLYGCGAGLPLASPTINGIPSTLADKINRRIDVNIINGANEDVRVLYDIPVVASQYRDTLWDNFNEKNKGVTFRVSFSKVSQMLKSDVLGWNLENIMEKMANEEQYTYTMGNFVKYDEAKMLKARLIKNGFEQVMILPYFEGFPIDNVKMMTLLKDYPQLEIYQKAEEK
jgi:outer membrane protein OmpA-like peptidoglycan-associated protein